MIDTSVRFYPDQQSCAKFKASTVKPPPLLSPGRKNLGLVAALVNIANHTGTTTTARQLADYARRMGWDSQWELDEDAKDQHGLARAIGDCLGNHPDALRLKKVVIDGEYGRVIPPNGVDHQFLISIGIDPASCRHPLLREVDFNAAP